MNSPKPIVILMKKKLMKKIIKILITIKILKLKKTKMGKIKRKMLFLKQ